MSRAQGLLPMVLASAIGIGTGIAIFQPAFKEEKEQKEQAQSGTPFLSLDNILTFQ